MVDIKIGLIGCGQWGKNYLNLFNRGAVNNSKLKYVHDIKDLKINNPETIFTKEIDNILNDPEIAGPTIRNNNSPIN